MYGLIFSKKSDLVEYEGDVWFDFLWKSDLAEYKRDILFDFL